MPRRTHGWLRAFGPRGMSQTARAIQRGVSFHQVQKYENGANRGSASRLHQAPNGPGLFGGRLFPARGDELDPVVGLAGPDSDGGRTRPGRGAGVCLTAPIGRPR